MALFLYLLIAFTLRAVRGCEASVGLPLIVFGDSTVDTGNNNHINTSLDFSANYPPHGQQFFGKPSGRFCNGRIFVDYICESLGIPHTSPYLEPGADYTSGVNFGSGGAGVLPETNGGQTVPLGSQLEYFSEFEKAVYESRGSRQAKKFFSDAVYVISIANNDYMSGYFSVPELREQFTPQEFVLLVVTEIVKACEIIYSKGARKLLVLDAGPLGCVPALRQFHPTGGCFQPAGDLAVAHNHALRSALKNWEAEHTDATVLVVGLHQFMMERILDPTAFGYTEGVAACCGVGPLRGRGHCGRPNPITGEEHEKCDNPEDYVFWDFYHGSERMHEEFAKVLWEGVPAAVTAPLSLRQLVERTPAASDCDDDEQLLAAGFGGSAIPIPSGGVHMEPSSF